MQQAVILDAVRTPIGRLRGALATVRPDNLLAHVISRLLTRHNLAGERIDEVFAGCANQAGEDNRNVARMASLLAGLPYEVPAVTVNRLCASGLEAVTQAVRAIWVGDHSLIIAGGVESMTRAPYVMGKPGEPFESGPRTMFDSALGWRFPNPRMEARFPLESMGETAENVARHYDISRVDQDAFACASHARALAAWDAGFFAAEVVPFDVQKKGVTQSFERDEGPRADATLTKLATLKPVFRVDGTVTAGNASPLNDGAAALLIATPERAQELGLTPLARVISCASAGVDPRMMGIGPVPATHKALARAQVRIADLDIIEINEAFAAQALAVIRTLGCDPERVNVHGGALALGHPLGASGTRLIGTLAHALRQRGGRYGLATLCVGVGQGASVILERWPA